MICAWRIGDVIVDPGPASCLPALLAAIGDEPPRVLALTHIHLDHAGATGALVRRFGDVEVWVHERGAPHLIDPSRLLASAGRLYGPDMQRLWGDVLPVPEANVRTLRGGERLGPFRVAYTPGHASHHVSYLDERGGQAFTGDVTGVRIGAGPVLAPTPPPDIDLDAWRASLRTIEAWGPERLCLTHFGDQDGVEAHLARMRAALEEAARWAQTLDEDGLRGADAGSRRAHGRRRHRRRLRAGAAARTEPSGPRALPRPRRATGRVIGPGPPHALQCRGAMDGDLRGVRGLSPRRRLPAADELAGDAQVRRARWRG